MSSEGSTEGLVTEQALDQDHLCLNPEFAVQVHMVCLTSLCQTPVCKWKERTGSSRCGNTASGLSASRDPFYPGSQEGTGAGHCRWESHSLFCIVSPGSVCLVLCHAGVLQLGMITPELGAGGARL